MPAHNSSELTSLVQKLAQRSPLLPADKDALLRLPYDHSRASAGTYLFREGEAVDSCILMLAGFSYQSKLAGDGGRQIVSIHLRGDLLGMQNSFLGKVDHSAQALTSVEVVYIKHADILKISEAHPAVARALWCDAQVDASMLREWVLNLGRRSARRRICHLLCEMAVRQEAAGISKGPRYEWPMTQEHIADATGLTIVHVNRMLQALRGEGLIEMDRRSVTILDARKLTAEADFTTGYLHQEFGGARIEDPV